MNGAHLHLILGHLAPIGGGFTLILFVFALVQKTKELKRTAMWFAFLTGVAAFIASMTGNSAEETILKISGMTKLQIEPHISYSLYYLISITTIGIIALLGLFLSRASTAVLHKFVIIVFILSILASFLGAMTSYTGGKIRHNEVENLLPTKPR